MSNANDSAYDNDSVGNQSSAPLIQGAGISYGIDMVSVGFTVVPDLCEFSDGAWQHSFQRNLDDGQHVQRFMTTVMAAENVGITVRLIAHPRWWCTVEYNPARLLDPDGTTLADPADLVRVTAAVLGSLHHLVVAAGATDDEGQYLGEVPEDLVRGMRLYRLDIARDFETEGTAFWRKQLASTRHPRLRVNTDGRRLPGGVPPTVYLGSKDNGFCIYDKAEQSKGKAAAGTLRVEWRGRSDGWLKKAGLATVGDATPEKIAETYLDFFSEIGLDRPRTRGGAAGRIRELKLSPSKSYTLLGIMTAATMGEDYGLSRSVMTGYEKHAERIGHRLGDPVTSEVGETLRLDVSAGREVIEDAAVLATRRVGDVKKKVVRRPAMMERSKA